MMPTCQSKLNAIDIVSTKFSFRFCTEKTCGAPPIVRHSEIIQPDRTTNETIQYICQDGYQLQGAAILKCLSSQWQPMPPICERE